MVSSTGTYSPVTPVNCSATLKGWEKNRARKVQRFFSQPFSVAEQFTGVTGEYVPVEDTIKGFREILDGKHDDVPEQAFFMCGSIEGVLAKAKEL